MAETTFTSNYQIKLIGTGLEAGTWGMSTNENLERIEQALGDSVSLSVITPGGSSDPATVGNSWTMEWITKDTASAFDVGSEGRARFVEFTCDGSPTDKVTVEIRGGNSGEYPDRLYIIKNGLTPGVVKTATITNAEKTNPIKITAANVGDNALANGEVVTITGVFGMVELNGNSYTVAGRTDADFELDGINGTTDAYTAYSGGVGTVTGPAVDIGKLVLDGGSGADVTLLNGGFALVINHGSASDGSYLVTQGVYNALSSLQIDDLTFPGAPTVTAIGDMDLVVKSESETALEIKNSEGTYLGVDTRTAVGGPPGSGPVLNLRTATVVVGDGDNDGLIKVYGDNDLALKSGSATTGSISIGQGAGGDISITPNTSGKVIVGETSDVSETIDGISTTLQVTVTVENTFSDNERVRFTGIVSDTDVISGALNAATHQIDTASASSFTLVSGDPDGSAWDGDTYTGGGIATGVEPANVTTSGTNDLVIDTNEGSSSGSITIPGILKNIQIAPDSTGRVVVGSGGAVASLVSSGAFDLELGTNAGGTGAQVTVGDGTNGGLTLTPAGTGGVVIASSQSSPGVSIAEPAAAITNIESTGGGLTTTITADDFPTATWAESGNLVYISGVTPSSFNGGPFPRIGGDSTTLIVTRDTSALDPYVSGGTVTLGSYLNFGDTAGTTGYGLRSMGGNVQAKNVGGAWGDVYTSGLVSGDGTYFQSSEIVCVRSDAASIEHGLGSTPRLVIASLKMNSASGSLAPTGFIENDEIIVTNSLTPRDDRGISVGANPTHVFYGIGSSTEVFYGIPKTGGNDAAYTNNDATVARWSLVIKAWK